MKRGTRVSGDFGKNLPGYEFKSRTSWTNQVDHSFMPKGMSRCQGYVLVGTSMILPPESGVRLRE